MTLTSVAVKAGDQTLLTLAGDKLAYWTRVARDTQTPTTTIGPGPGRHRVARRRRSTTSAPVPTELVAHHRRRPRQADAAAAARHDDRDDVAPVTVSDPQARRDLAAAGRPELVGRQQLLRHDGAPDGAEPARRQALGRRTVRHRLRAARAPTARCSPATRPKPESYPYFGADIHAVADGPVVGVLDGLPEQVAGADPDRAAARPVRRQPHRAGHRRRQLRVLRAPEDRQRQGQARRPAHHRAGDRATSATPATPMRRTCTST